MLRKLITGLVFLLTLFCFFSAASPSLAVAEGPVAAPAAFFTLNVNIGGKITSIKYSLEALKDLPQVQRIYSSIDPLPAPDTTLAQGVLLTDLLGRANIDFTKVQSIKLASSDGWSHSFSKSYLFGATRYYYPNLAASWDKSAANPPVFLAGVEDNQSPVEPILALRSYRERFSSQMAWEKLSTGDGLKFCFGQTEPAEDTDHNFGRNIDQMEVIMNDSSPFVNLSFPSEAPGCKPGATVNLSGEAQNLTTVILRVDGPEETAVCSEKKLDVSKGVLTSDFTLPDKAAEGYYTIVISKQGKPSTYIATFKFRVSKSAGVVQQGDNSNKASGPGDAQVTPDSRGSPGAEGSGEAPPPADSLTIKVGYYGEPYVVKKIFTLSDINALPQVQQAYTFIDAMPAVVIDSVIKGVKLSDVLASAGIDLNSVQTFYFYTNDITQKWYQSLPKSSLYAPRYYYPNLPAHWDRENARALPGAAKGAAQVEPVLATIDNWQRLATTPDFNNPDASTRFRLMFGQMDTTEETASKSAKWVHTIELLLGGTPPKGVKLDKSTVNLKIGSTFNLAASVEGQDQTTDKRVTWSSSDPAVAMVDEQGRVTIVGRGTAKITVATVVGNKIALCVVNGLNQADSKSNILKNRTDAGDSAKKINSAEALKSKTAADEFVKPAGSQPWRVYEMSAEAVPLQPRQSSGRVIVCTAAIAVILFLYGSGRKYREFIKEVTK